MRRILIGTGLAVLLLASCAKETSPQTSLQPRRAAKAGETVQITAVLSSMDLIETRVSLTQGNLGGLIPSWQDGDVLLVGGERFTLVSQDGRGATFSGKAPSGSRFDIVYTPSGDGAASAQQGSGDTRHLGYSATLKGVDSYEDIHFNYGWAAEHGGKFVQSGALQLVLNLPSDTETVSKVSIAVDGTTLSELNVENGAVQNHAFTAWLPLSDADIQFASDKEVTLTVEADEDELSNTFFPAPQTLYGGFVIKLVTAADKWSRTLSGKGSETDPYEIKTVEDFNNIRNLLTEGTFTYFRQTADLDFTGVGSWVPINLENAAFGIMYDGQGHKISHLTCEAGTWASIFGVLHGKVQNLTVEDSRVTTTGTSPCGTLAAWVGNSDGSLQGHLENVHVVRGYVASPGYAYLGGLCGRACASSFKDCSFDGTVTRTGTAAYTTTYYPVGGIVGQALNDVKISGCSVSGSIVTASGRAAGGIVGLCSVALDITGCTSTMSIDACDDVVGGIVGYYGNGTISGCKVEADLTVRQARATSNPASYLGGIAGHSSGSPVITQCSYKGTLSGASGIVGGILGQSYASSGSGAHISECFSQGTINATQLIGGIVGRATNQGLVVEDCGSVMDVLGTASYNGGIVGDAPQNTAVRRCYATGKVQGIYALGGIVGRAFGRQGSSASLDTDVKTTVEDCIAFNASIKTTTSGGETPANHYSGGAVVGCSSRPNTLKNCWRSPSMDFQFYADASLNVLFDHADSSPSAPLAQPAGSAKWFSPYHGKAAGNGSSVASVAQNIGWSGSVWDLSLPVPALKNLPK